MGLVLTLSITAFLRPGLTTKHWLTPSETWAVRGHLDMDRMCVSKDFSKSDNQGLPAERHALGVTGPAVFLTPSWSA